MGLAGYQARKLAFALNMSGKTVRHFGEVPQPRCTTAYWETDAEMLEINPMVIDGEGKVLALDAKMSFDGNALYRHKDIEALRDIHEEDPSELEAGKFGLSYVKLDGNIGCLVNGAGLAMSTMDIIQFKGAELRRTSWTWAAEPPRSRSRRPSQIITSDPAVKGILVNIFGGIMKCDVIAEGVIAAVKEVGLEVPLVVRLAGTNVELGKKILAESGLAITPAGDLEEAAEAIVAAVQG